MKGKFLKHLTQFCSLFGTLGQKIQNWAEFKEWEYWNDEQCKIINIPDEVKVFLWYNRKGDFLKVHVNYWPKKDGRYDWNREEVLRVEFTREEILAKAVSVNTHEKRSQEETQ